MRRWIRVAPFIVLLVATGFCEFWAVNTSGLISIFCYAGVVIFGAAYLSILFGLLSADRLERSSWGKNVKFTLFPSNVHPERLVICLPGMGNSGDIVFAQHVQWLSRFGDVEVVNYPDRGFDGEAVITAVVDRAMRRQPAYREMIVVGQSMGVPIGIVVMSRLKMQLPQTRFYFISVFWLRHGTCHQDAAHALAV